MAKRGRRPKVNNGPFAEIRQAGQPIKPGTIASDPVASECWDRLVSLLSEAKTLSEGDQGILAVFCSNWSTICRCRALLEPKVDPDTGEVKDPFVVFNDKNGSTKIHPAVTVLAAAERSLASFASSLGLTPVDRARAGVIPDLEEHDELEDFLNG